MEIRAEYKSKKTGEIYSIPVDIEDEVDLWGWRDETPDFNEYYRPFDWMDEKEAMELDGHFIFDRR
jgi:hypothetical protein